MAVTVARALKLNNDPVCAHLPVVPLQILLKVCQQTNRTLEERELPGVDRAEPPVLQSTVRGERGKGADDNAKSQFYAKVLGASARLQRGHT